MLLAVVWADSKVTSVTGRGDHTEIACFCSYSSQDVPPLLGKEVFLRLEKYWWVKGLAVPTKLHYLQAVREI